MRRQFIVIRETPELKKGAILEEMCDDGTQDFKCVTEDKFKHGLWETWNNFARDAVLKNPQFFEEVAPLYVPKSMRKKVLAFVKKLK